MTVDIILPEGALGDPVSVWSEELRRLTAHLAKTIYRDRSFGFGLGGEYGYGAEHDNEVFMMHPFCWCEEESCLWCGQGEPNFIYKPTGTMIWWYKWIGRGMEIEQPDAVVDQPGEIVDRCIVSVEGYGEL